MDLLFFDNNIIMNFIKTLSIKPQMKENLLKKVSSFSIEEKIFLWKILIDIYNLDKEEEKAIKNIEKNF